MPVRVGWHGIGVSCPRSRQRQPRCGQGFADVGVGRCGWTVHGGRGADRRASHARARGRRLRRPERSWRDARRAARTVLEGSARSRAARTSHDRAVHRAWVSRERSSVPRDGVAGGRDAATKAPMRRFRIRCSPWSRPGSRPSTPTRGVCCARAVCSDPVAYRVAADLAIACGRTSRTTELEMQAGQLVAANNPDAALTGVHVSALAVMARTTGALQERELTERLLARLDAVLATMETVPPHLAADVEMARAMAAMQREDFEAYLRHVSPSCSCAMLRTCRSIWRMGAPFARWAARRRPLGCSRRRAPRCSRVRRTFATRRCARASCSSRRTRRCSRFRRARGRDARVARPAGLHTERRPTRMPYPAT